MHTTARPSEALIPGSSRVELRKAYEISIHSRILREQELTQIYASKSACVQIIISVTVHLSFDPDLRSHSWPAVSWILEHCPERTCRAALDPISHKCLTCELPK